MRTYFTCPCTLSKSTGGLGNAGARVAGIRQCLPDLSCDHVHQLRTHRMHCTAGHIRTCPRLERSDSKPTKGLRINPSGSFLRVRLCCVPCAIMLRLVQVLLLVWLVGYDSLRLRSLQWVHCTVARAAQLVAQRLGCHWMWWRTHRHRHRHRRSYRRSYCCLDLGGGSV